MSDKPNLQIGHVTPAEWRPKAEDAFRAVEEQRQRAEAWKEMAHRLAAVAEHIGYDTCEGVGIVRKADEALKAFDALKRSDL